MATKDSVEPYRKGSIFMACCREDIGTSLEHIERPVRIYDSREDPNNRENYEYYIYFGGYNARLADWYPSSALRNITDEERILYAKEIGFFIQADKEFLPRNIDKVVISQYMMCPWYFSPLPEEFFATRAVYICEYCFAMLTTERIYNRHIARCTCRSPPGDLIYRDNEVCFFEVNGSEHTNYCRNICLVARLFLQHKTLMADVDVFLFYVMFAKTNSKRAPLAQKTSAEQEAQHEPEMKRVSDQQRQNSNDDNNDDDSYHFVGFFSKEKQQENSLSCIVALPCFQKKGYGNIMIDFSYMLSSRECRLGGPEMPLSDLGLMSYLSYWKRRIYEVLARNTTSEISLLDISKQTMISYRNLIMAMNKYGLLMETPSNTAIYFRDEMADELRKCLEKEEKRGIHRLDDKYLHWVPYINMCYEYKS